MKCPKCGYVRLATDLAPEWQCPSCQVAYAKAQALAGGTFLARPAPVSQSVPEVAPAPIEPDDSGEQATIAASGQKIVIYSILFTIVLRMRPHAQAVTPFVSMVLAFAIAAYSLVGVVRICSALKKSQNEKLVFMALTCMPLVNLVALVVLNVKATALLRAAGWRVGLLGARP